MEFNFSYSLLQETKRRIQNSLLFKLGDLFETAHISQLKEIGLETNNLLEIGHAFFILLKRNLPLNIVKTRII